MSLYEKIKSILEEKFVRCDKIARIMSLAITSGKNVLLWGPGGHGKSEMVSLAFEVVLRELQLTDSELYIQSFGEGLDEAALWGGLDFQALETEKVLKYFPSQSFLAKKYCIFEELFDAPAVCLLALKDTLTSGWLRKGEQRFKMRTKVVIALTNKDPQEISDIGPAAQALVERFPLQLKVDWPSYEAKDYMELFNKVGPQLPGADLNGQQKVLAEVMAKAGENNMPVSPRTAVHALGVAKAAAKLRGADKVEQKDLLDLCFVPGMELLAEGLEKELQAANERAQAEANLTKVEAKFQLLNGELVLTGSPIKLLQICKKLESLLDETSKLKVTDSLTERRKKLREAIQEKAAEAQKKALDKTKV